MLSAKRLRDGSSDQELKSAIDKALEYYDEFLATVEQTVTFSIVRPVSDTASGSADNALTQ